MNFVVKSIVMADEISRHYEMVHCPCSDELRQVVTVLILNHSTSTSAEPELCEVNLHKILEKKNLKWH